jgi:hypothetical protein
MAKHKSEFVVVAHDLRPKEVIEREMDEVLKLRDLDWSKATRPGAVIHTPEEWKEIERSLAYIYATGTVESLALPIDTPEGCDDVRDWFDATPRSGGTPEMDAFENKLAAEAIAYLDSRGLIVYAPDNHNIVALKDEDEEAERA